MDKVWLASYPSGVPAEIDPHSFASVGDLFERSVERYRDKPAYANMGARLSYAELARQSAAFGAYLQKTLRLEKGARVALMMPNVLQYPVCLFGALRAGCTVVNCNPLHTMLLRESLARIAIADHHQNIGLQCPGTNPFQHRLGWFRSVRRTQRDTWTRPITATPHSHCQSLLLTDSREFGTQIWDGGRVVPLDPQQHGEQLFEIVVVHLDFMNVRAAPGDPVNERICQPPVVRSNGGNHDLHRNVPRLRV